MNMGGDPTEGAKPSSEEGGQASGMAGGGQRPRKVRALRTLVEMNSWPGAGGGRQPRIRRGPGVRAAPPCGTVRERWALPGAAGSPCCPREQGCEVRAPSRAAAVRADSWQLGAGVSRELPRENSHGSETRGGQLLSSRPSPPRLQGPSAAGRAGISVPDLVACAVRRTQEAGTC